MDCMEIVYLEGEGLLPEAKIFPNTQEESAGSLLVLQ